MLLIYIFDINERETIMKTISLQIYKDNEAFLEQMLTESQASLDELASRLINSRLYEMRSIRRDMDLFRGYLAKHPRKNQPLWFYGFKLRKSLGWTHSHLLDIEDEILGSRVVNKD